MAVSSQLLLLGQTQVLLGSSDRLLSIITSFLSGESTAKVQAACFVTSCRLLSLDLAESSQGNINMLRVW